jgi:GTPase
MIEAIEYKVFIMSRLPKLAIVGRPNVGKSALFNRICGRRIAIVDEAEGITRDRIYGETDFFGMDFALIDTGGIDPRATYTYNEQVRRQAEIAIEEADTIVMVVDGKIGITTLDQELADILLKTKKPVTLAVNKMDTLSQEYMVHQFYPLAITNIVGVSAVQGLNIAELLEKAFQDISSDELPEKDDSIKIAIVGVPNTGKSTLVNTLLDEERCIASPIPGTTRDSIDILFELNGQKYTLIDTAGIRRKRAEHEVVDKFAAMRTKNAIERADVCVFMLDSQKGMSTQEKQIASDIEEAGKGCLLFFNKWDLVKGHRMEHCLTSIRKDAHFLNYCPVVFGSAKTERNLPDVFSTVNEIYAESKKRINTHDLNKFVELSIQKTHPPMIKGKRLRIYYMVQVDSQPPKFVFFINRADLMTKTYQRYLYNQMRERYGFKGAPIVFKIKDKKKAQAPQ